MEYYSSVFSAGVGSFALQRELDHDLSIRKSAAYAPYECPTTTTFPGVKRTDERCKVFGINSHDELLKLGLDIGETSVTKYMARRRKAPSQAWRTFLQNQVSQLVSIDFFTVATIRFQVLYVFLVLAHDRSLHFNVTRHPIAEWTGQRLGEAFPLTNPNVTCCGIGMLSLARTCESRYETWA